MINIYILLSDLVANEIFKLTIIYLHNEIIVFIRRKPTLFENSLFLDKGKADQDRQMLPCLGHCDQELLKDPGEPQ
jgi:hypothetical protein